MPTIPECPRQSQIFCPCLLSRTEVATHIFSRLKDIINSLCFQKSNNKAQIMSRADFSHKNKDDKTISGLCFTDTYSQVKSTSLPLQLLFFCFQSSCVMMYYINNNSLIIIKIYAHILHEHTGFRNHFQKSWQLFIPYALVHTQYTQPDGSQ